MYLFMFVYVNKCVIRLFIITDKGFEKVPKIVHPDGKRESRTKVDLHIHTQSHKHHTIIYSCVCSHQTSKVQRLNRILTILGQPTDGLAVDIQCECSPIHSHNTHT